MQMVDHSNFHLAHSILLESFLNDPFNNWIVGNKLVEERLKKFIATSLEVTIPMQTVFMNEEKNAIAVWVSPDRVRFTLLEELKYLSTLWKINDLGHFFKVVPFMISMNNHHPKDPHFYLLALGVKNEAQGKGFGSKLLSQQLINIDQSQNLAFLETSNTKNLPLYNRFDFKITSQKKIPGSDHSLYFLTRNPRSS